MIYMHESNFKSKIAKNYNGIGDKINEFYLNTYLETKMKLLAIDFSQDDEKTFRTATDIINNYYEKLNNFTKENKITSQSKFRSTFLEELSTYLFADNDYIKNGELGI